MVFTLQSIKSRIETQESLIAYYGMTVFLLYSPLNQGLKPTTTPPFPSDTIVFTLQSIKSRIETIKAYNNEMFVNSVFTLQSIKSRIETRMNLQKQFGNPFVFTLQSIKSRIETSYHSYLEHNKQGFLLYSPLNQGLKLIKYN